MYDFFLAFHSYFRYLVILLILLGFIMAVKGMIVKSTFDLPQKKISKWAVLSCHIQLLLGIVLYFISPFVKFAAGMMGNTTLRYWTVEHFIVMLIAIVLITIGNAKAKKIKADSKKHKVIVQFFGLGILLITISILQSQRALF